MALTVPALAYDYGYYSWQANGCPATPMGDAAFNHEDLFAAAQWWTVTFTSSNTSVGGMVRILCACGCGRGCGGADKRPSVIIDVVNFRIGPN